MGIRQTYCNHRTTQSSGVGTLIYLICCFVLATAVSELHATEIYVGEVQSVRTAQGQTALSWQATPPAAILAFRVEQDIAGTFKSISADLIPATGLILNNSEYSLSYQPTLSEKGDIFRISVIDTAGNSITFGPFDISVPAPIVAQRQRAISVVQEPTVPKTESVASPGEKVKVHIREPGLYYISAVEIADSLVGFSETSVQSLLLSTNIALTHGETHIPWMADTNAWGIRFYAEESKSQYATDNIYWIKAGTGTVFTTRTNGVSTPAPSDQTFPVTNHWEENLDTVNATEPTDDFWIWDGLYSWSYPGFKTEETYEFTVNHPKTNAEGYAEGTIAVLLQGLNAPVSHRALVSVNGQLVASNLWADYGAPIVEATATNLIAGTNTLTIDGLFPGTYGIYAHQWFNVSYPRRYTTDSDMLWCVGDSNSIISIDGFTTNTIAVFDVSTPMKPVVISDTIIDTTTTGYRITFLPDTPSNTYYAVNIASANTPYRVRGRTPSPLRSSTNAVQHLTLAPLEFLSTASELTTYRRAQGLRSRLIDIEDVYDHFSFGMKSPWAIRDLLAFASTNWTTAPRYVVLAGSGSIDYKNYAGYNDCQIPPAIVPAPVTYWPYVSLVASDALLANIRDGQGPDIAIGRLHCQTTQEVANVIGKIVAFEGTGTWKQVVHMVADDYDPDAGDFSASCDIVATYIPTNSYLIDRNYQDTQAVANVKARLIDALNNGAYVVSYFGHGNANSLARLGSILGSGDLTSITNGVRPALMTAMTCGFANFGQPGHEFLGESLVSSAQGGTCGLWGMISETYNFASQQLANGLFDSMFQAETIRIGDAILDSTAVYEASGTLPYVLDLLCLLGDPAMAMPPPGYSFGSWQMIIFSPEQLADPNISGPLADPDGDGIANLIEFSNGSNPTNWAPISEFEAWLEPVDIGSGETNDHATVSFRQLRIREGIESFVESCTDLLQQAWKFGPGINEQISVTPVDDTLEEVVIRVHPDVTTNQQTFVRLKTRLTN